MTKEEIYLEIETMLGQVPGFIKSIPDDALEGEWNLFKRFELMPTKLEPKVRELMGVAISAAERCWYCANFHSGLARLHGATDEEIQEAVHYAKFTAGWSTYLNGILYDHDQFLSELHQVGEHIQKNR